MWLDNLLGEKPLSKLIMLASTISAAGVANYIGLTEGMLVALFGRGLSAINDD